MTIPLVILAGSDGRSVELPEAGRSQHPIKGYKGADLVVNGRPLITRVVERMRASGWFDPVYIAGPAALFSPLGLGAEVIDTDSSVGANIRAATEHMRSRHRGQPLGYMSCDIMPDLPALHALRSRFEAAAPLDIFFPLVEVPPGEGRRSVLGVSSWKPTYRIVPPGSEGPVEILPGHLVIVDPAALRLAFLYRLLDLTYRTRNRPLEHRRNVLIAGIGWELVYQDLRHLVQLRAPSLTVTVIGTGLRVVMGLRKGDLAQAALERAARRVMVLARHRRRHPERGVCLPITDALSLARDIDTVEEARALGAEPFDRCAARG